MSIYLVILPSINLMMNDISLKELAVTERLSTRTINLCEDADLTTLRELLVFSQTGPNFKIFRNCGIKTSTELERLCDKYRYLISDDKTTDLNLSETETPFREVIPSDDMDLDVLFRVENISRRSYHVCLSGGLTSLQMILQYYDNNRSKSFKAHRNCGAVSDKELVNICLKYGNQYFNLPNEPSKQKGLRSPVERFLYPLKLDKYIVIHIKRNIVRFNSLQVFKIIDFLINNQYVLNLKEQIEVFKYTFNFYLHSQNPTIGEIADKTGLTHERVLQVRELVYRKIKYSYGFINLNKDIDFFQYYPTILNDNIIYITQNDANKINKREDTKFSPLFIFYIFSELLSNHYSKVGDFSTLFSKDMFNKELKHLDLFLVNMTLAKQFDFGKFLIFLRQWVNRQPSHIETLTYQNLITKFKRNNTTDDIAIIEAIKSIVYYRFNSVVRVNNQELIFCGISKKTNTYYAIEILMNSPCPMHYTEIYRQMSEMGVATSEKCFHKLLHKNSGIFGLKGSGIFDLRSRGGYFGSIRDVAYQVLLERGKPISFKKLVNLLDYELLYLRQSIYKTLIRIKHDDRFEKDKKHNIGLKEWKSEMK